MQLIGFQTDIAWEDPTSNFDRIRAAVAQETIPAESLLVFPELSTTGFTMEVDEIGEDPSGPTSTFFSELARTHRSFVIAGIPRRREGKEGIANEAVCFAPDGSELGAYQKHHPFPLAGEPDHYLRGDQVEVLNFGDWSVAPFICYDLRFPEEFREATRRGADLLVVIANWPAVRVEHWLTLLQARAIENQAFVIGINRTGQDPNHEYPGASVIFDPIGKVLARIGTEVGVVRATADRQLVLDWRERFPALSEWQATTSS